MCGILLLLAAGLLSACGLREDKPYEMKKTVIIFLILILALCGCVRKGIESSRYELLNDERNAVAVSVRLDPMNSKGILAKMEDTDGGLFFNMARAVANAVPSQITSSTVFEENKIVAEPGQAIITELNLVDTAKVNSHTIFYGWEHLFVYSAIDTPKGKKVERSPYGGLCNLISLEFDREMNCVSRRVYEWDPYSEDSGFPKQVYEKFEKNFDAIVYDYPEKDALAFAKKVLLKGL